jgi:hypothetical protein
LCFWEVFVGLGGNFSIDMLRLRCWPIRSSTWHIGLYELRVGHVPFKHWCIDFFELCELRKWQVFESRGAVVRLYPNNLLRFPGMHDLGGCG